MYLRSCILVPAILVPDKDRPVLWDKHAGNSDTDRPVLWYKHVGISDKDRSACNGSNLYQGIHETVTWYYWPLLSSGPQY